MESHTPPHPPRNHQEDSIPQIVLIKQGGKPLWLWVLAQVQIKHHTYCLVELPMPDGTKYPQVFRRKGSHQLEWEEDTPTYEYALECLLDPEGVG